MAKKYRINKDKNIGTVIFILEGSSSEFNLLRTIFVKILGYELHFLKRDTDAFIFRGTKNPYSKVIAFNFNGNCLYDINEEELNKLFFKMSSELELKPENHPIYYIYDRDIKSYNHLDNEIRPYLEKYGNSYDNEDGSQGLLLLSYPALESFVISSFKDNSFLETMELGNKLKHFMAESKLYQDKIKTDNLIHAAEELDKYLKSIDISSYSIDDFKETNLAVYDAEQSFYKSNKTFHLVSLLCIALIDLGIIEEID
ncbi:MAG: hypothetical protein ACI33K_09490 [Clostridiaceae bacterium]